MVIIIIVGMINGCTPVPIDTSTIVYGLTLAPTGIDPHLNASSELGIPLRSVYDTLIFRDPETGKFIPGLADKWSISEDGLVYTFHLRQDVSFHDGTPFNAEAVKANIEHITNPDHHSQKAIFMLGPLQTVEVQNEFSIAFYLREPFAPLLDSLSQVYLGMASPAALEKWGPTDYQFHQVGTGPYRFVEYIPNDHLTLTRNPDYRWAPSIYTQKQAEIETIIFRFYEDPATRALALESGEVDILGEIPPTDARRLADDPRFSLYRVSIPGQPLQLLFNTQQPPTDCVDVRAALILGVDRATIVETLFGNYSPVAQNALSADVYSFTPARSLLEYNPEAANALLEQSGWIADNKTGQRYRDGTPMQIKIVVPPWGFSPEVGQMIRAAWDMLGIDVALQVAPGFGQLKEIQSSGVYNAISINFAGTDPDLLRSFFYSGGLYNWSQYEDNKLDHWLDQAAHMLPTDTGREILYQKIDNLIQEQALILPIRYYVNLVIARSNIDGLRFSADGWYPFLIELQ